MKTLQEITNFDNYILEETKKIIINNELLNNLNIQKLYCELFKNYSFLNELESLKRAVFIQWYSIIEPCENTGMGEMDFEIEKKNIDKINNNFKIGLLDKEFIFFLNHYYNIGSWYFDSLGFNIKIIENINSNFFLDRNSFKKRGIMGTYWNELLNNS